MLNSLSSFLFNTYPSQEDALTKSTSSSSSSYEMQELDGDWLLVDPIDGLTEDVSKKGPASLGSESSLDEDENQENSPVTPLLAIEHRRSSSLSLYVPLLPLENQLSPPSSPSPQLMDGSWYVTPPPCFTAGSPAFFESSPLENLLIEHPSMSVYGPVSNFSFLMRRSESPVFERSCDKIDEQRPEVVEGDENIDVINAREVVTVMEQPNRPVIRLEGHRAGASIRRRQYTRALSASLDAVALEERILLVQAQKVQYCHDQRKLKSSNFERQNRARQSKSNKGHSQRKNQWLMQPIKCNTTRKC